MSAVSFFRRLLGSKHEGAALARDALAAYPLAPHAERGAAA